MKTISKTPYLPASFLYVPAHREDLFDKALSTQAHAVIVDLEDGVPVEDKTSARNGLAKLLGNRLSGLLGGNSVTEAKTPQVFIRINSGEEAQTDLAVIDELISQDIPFSGVVFTKAEKDTVELLKTFEESALTLICLIESAAGLSALTDLAKHCHSFGVGRQDLAADLRIDSSLFEALLPYLSRIVFESRLANIAAPIAPTYLNVKETDTDKILHYSEEFYRHGFRSQTAIHPKFLDAIHNVFLPRVEEYEHARTMLNRYKFEETFTDDSGNFVDAAVIRQYQEVIQRYEH